MKSRLSILAACALCLPLAICAAPNTSDTTHKAWPAETLSGKITIVDPGEKLVVLQTPDGVSYDMLVGAKTRILSGDQSLTLRDLAADRNRSASVKFVPEGRGDVARSIRIGG